jgi:GDP-D-mannose dehydratase
LASMATKHALSCGVSGQDGSYLAELLHRRGYSVSGTSRDAQVSSFQNPGAAAKAEKVLGWKASRKMPEVVAEMVRAEQMRRPYAE